jgi:hypothetical protein
MGKSPLRPVPWAGQNGTMEGQPADRTLNPAQRAALARLTRATAQVARWHAEYEDALTAAWELNVPYRVLAGTTGESREALNRRLGGTS